MQSAFELVLRPAVSSVGNDLQDGGSEELWEHLVLLDDSSKDAMPRTAAIAHGARSVAHMFNAPAAVLEWLIALEDELAKILDDRAADNAHDNIQPDETSKAVVLDTKGLPSFMSFASRADATVSLGPSASALSHLGTGSDVALVMGWPSMESFVAALAPEGPLAHGLLLGLPPDNLLWGRLREAADGNYALDEGAGENGVRLRVAWQRSSGKRGRDGSGDILDVSLEAAPKPASSHTWQGTKGEWFAERARAWGSTLRPSDDAHPWLLLQPLRGAPRAMRLYSASDGKGLATMHAPLTAAEAAAEAAVEAESGASSRGVRLWFLTGEHPMQFDPVPGAGGLESHRRLTLGSYYRDICATTQTSFSTSEPDGCSSWYMDASNMWCGSSYGGSCNFCYASSVEGGNLSALPQH